MQILRSKPTANNSMSPTAKIEHFTLPRPKSRKKLVVVAALLAIVLATGIAFAMRARSVQGLSVTTVPAVRQTLVQSVTATGTVNPQNTIAVGTQDSGTVSEIDVDYNTHVKRGQVLAKLDPTTFQAALEQAQAQLAQAQAQAQSAQATATGATEGIGNANATDRSAVATAQAASVTAQANQVAVASAASNVTKSQSALDLAQQTLARDRSLLSQGYIAQSQADADTSAEVAAQTTLDAAKAAVSQAQLTAQASVSQAASSRAQSAAQGYSAEEAQATAQTQIANANAMEAAVSSAQAQVRAAQLNLEKTVIASPVDGTVIARSVSVGTTVAASLQTPTLFTIAQNLDKMEIDLAVGEPDIGNVRAGDSVEFSVLAYPATTFHGSVSQVRIDPTTTNNVVTYDTVVLVGNQSGKLLPGMTANAAIDVAKSANAIVVPLAALSYQPSIGTGTHRHSAASSGTASSTSAWGQTTGSASSTAAAGSQSRIFVERGGKLVRIPVSVLLTSGTEAAVSATSGTIAVGDAVVTADATPRSTSATRATPANPLSGGFAGGTGSATRGLH